MHRLIEGVLSGERERRSKLGQYRKLRKDVLPAGLQPQPDRSQQERRPEAGRSWPGEELGVGWQKQRKWNTGSRGSEGLRASAPGLTQRVGCALSDVSPLVLHSAGPQVPLTTAFLPSPANESQARSATPLLSLTCSCRCLCHLRGPCCCHAPSAADLSSWDRPAVFPALPVAPAPLTSPLPIVPPTLQGQRLLLWLFSGDPHHPLLFQGFPHFYTYFLCSVPSAESFQRRGPS